MATIALAAAAASITSGMGAVAAAAITTGLTLAGGILDNAFIFPAIFGRPDIGTIEGPRLSTLAPQDGSEGVPLNFCIGSRVRVGGNVIWVTDLEEVSVSSGGGGGGKGGGGGGGGQSTTYEYYVSAMIAICEGEIEGICKVYADGKTFVKNADPGTMDTTTTVEVTATLQLLANLPFTYYGPMQIYNASGGASYWSDLGFQGTGEVSISGYSDADNNGTFEVKNKRVRTTDNNESLTLRYASYPPVVNSNESASVVVSQTVDRFPANVDRVAFYPGASNDAIDSLYEGAVDTELGGTPRYKGVAKMVIERLALADYGNRLPQFNFVVNMQDPTTVREAIAAIMARGGFTSGDYDVSGIDISYELEGYSVSGAKSVAAMLEPIMLVWNLGVLEDNGVLMFYERGDEPTVSEVRDKDWTARPHGAGAEDIASISESPTFDLPSEVSVSYFDSSNKDAAAEVKARRIDTVSDITQAIRIPIWMDAGRARVVAETRLWRAWNDRYRASFNLPPRYLQLTEGDIVPIEISGETYNVRLTRISRGANWLLACEGIVQSNTEFDFTADGDTQTDGDDDVSPPGNLLLFIFNAAALSDDHISTPGYYWAFAMENPDSDFNGGSLYAAITEAGTYSFINSSSESVIIATEDQLPDVDNPNIFDEINTIDVDAINGTLASVSEQDLLAGSNRLVMSNGEIIGFQTATTIGTNRYRLSKLLRGRRNTEQYTGTHSADGEIGVVVDSSLNFESINLSAINTTEYFKPVAVGQAVDDLPAEAFTFLACTIKPFSVANIEATRDGSNNVTATWDRRSRANYPELVGTIPPPLVDGMEEYEIDLYNPGDTEVENTYSSTSPTIAITDTDIVAAGYSSGDPINIRVYQISPTIGRGTEKKATV